MKYILGIQNKFSVVKERVVMIFSLDIFDTLITRTVAEPRGIFALMQNSLRNFPTLFKNNFVEIRMSAEYYVRTHSKQAEITFDEIYEFIEKNYCLSIKQAEFLKELEIKTELENSIGIERNIQKLKEWLKNDNKIILISDMYLPQKIIRSLLCKHNSIFEHIPIYVSCEHNATKCTGKLFEIVKEKENIEFKKWTHFGDNRISDFKIPKKLGINAEHYEFEGLKQYEKKFICNSSINQLIIGTSRNLRLIECSGNKKMELGCSFAAPILFSYVSWILETAVSTKLVNLYFVMRDGFILKQIADIIIKQRKLSIGTHYIYGSKKVWKNPEKEKITADYLKQEIEFSKEFAFVDVYGSGETHAYLNEITKKYGLGQIKQFYFESHSELWKNNLVFNFMPKNMSFLLEPLLRSIEGQTIDYKFKDSKIVPIISEKESADFEKYKYQNYIDGVILFSKSLVTLDINLLQSDFCFKYLEYGNKTPDKELAVLIGTIPFKDDAIKFTKLEIAPPITLLSLPQIFLNKDYRGLLWIRVARSNVFIKSLFVLIRLIYKK